LALEARKELTVSTVQSVHWWQALVAALVATSLLSPAKMAVLAVVALRAPQPLSRFLEVLAPQGKALMAVSALPLLTAGAQVEAVAVRPLLAETQPTQRVAAAATEHQTASQTLP
jgi:hypothetical protein